jgi:hypothetical protein
MVLDMTVIQMLRNVCNHNAQAKWSRLQSYCMGWVVIYAILLFGMGGHICNPIVWDGWSYMQS